MTEKRIKFSSEKKFKSFMAQYKPVVDLDSIKNEFPDGTRIADYAITNTIVIELKTLKEDPTQKMESYLYEIMRRPELRNPLRNKFPLNC